MASTGEQSHRPIRSAADRSSADRALAADLTRRLLSTTNTAERRQRRLARVREAIESSDYENALKLSVAVDRMIARHGNA